MGPLQQLGVSVERPPYYRPPRCRPISFERPSHYYQLDNTGYDGLSGGDRATAQASSFLRENLATFIEHNQATKQYMHPSNQDLQDTMLADGRTRYPITNPLNTLPTSQNSSPKPYSRSFKQTIEDGSLSLGNLNTIQQTYKGDQLQQRPPQQTSPRILVNDQPVLCRYPTSTVHKSMLNSRPRQMQTNCSNNFDEQHQIAYSRLISPTLPLSGPSNGSISPDVSLNASAIGGRTSNPVPEHQQPQPQQQSKLQDKVEPHFRLAQQANAEQTIGIGLRGDGNLANQGTTSEVGSAKREQVKRDAVHSSSISSLLPTSFKQKLPAGLGTTVCPDSKQDEYMWNRQLERVSIAHQTYRTLPIVSPRPKARHDLATGTYMNYGQDLSYELALQSRPSSSSSREHERKIQQAIEGANKRPAAAAAVVRYELPDVSSTINSFASSLSVIKIPPSSCQPRLRL